MVLWSIKAKGIFKLTTIHLTEYLDRVFVTIFSFNLAPLRLGAVKFKVGAPLVPRQFQGHGTVVYNRALSGIAPGQATPIAARVSAIDSALVLQAGPNTLSVPWKGSKEKKLRLDMHQKAVCMCAFLYKNIFKHVLSLPGEEMLFVNKNLIRTFLQGF